MHAAEVSLGVRLFTEGDVGTLDYAKALGIYAQSTGPACKTDTRQITYWASRYNKDYEDKILIYGLYKNDEVIGFLLAFYFVEESLLVVDHIAVESSKRSYATFMLFSELVKSDLYSYGYDIKYVLVEVVDDSFGHPMPYSAYSFIRLLKIVGFKVAKINYMIPSSEKDEPERTTKGVLMVYCQTGAKEVPRDRFLILVNAILYKLYYRWYEPFLGGNKNKYKIHLDKLYSLYRDSIKLGRNIILNGYNGIDDIQLIEKEDIYIVDHSQKSLKPVLISIASVMLLFILIIGSAMLTNYDLKLMSIIFVVATVTYISISGIFMSGARSTLKDLNGFFSSFFNKKDS